MEVALNQKMHTHTPPLKPQNLGARATQILPPNDPGEGGGGGDTPIEVPKRATFPGGAEQLEPGKSLNFFRWSCQFLPPKMTLPAPPIFVSFE